MHNVLPASLYWFKNSKSVLDFLVSVHGKKFISLYENIFNVYQYLEQLSHCL
jgi:hypothetical protein